MKKLIGIFLIIASVSAIFAGCNTKDQGTQEDTFTFLSAQWGDSWENVQKQTGLAGDLKEQGHRHIAQIENVEYLGTKGTAVFQLDKQLQNTQMGLYNVMFVYQDVDEARLLEEMEKTFGERKKSYLDKNGVENPIGFSGGWVSEETVEETLTEEQRETLVDIYVKERNLNINDAKDKSVIDAFLRAPLVSIVVDEELNKIEFKGSSAATVKYISELNGVK